MKKFLFTTVFSLTLLTSAFSFSKTVAAEITSDGYYKQTYYYDEKGERYLIANYYVNVNDSTDAYSIFYDKDGTTTRYEKDHAIDIAYKAWAESQPLCHYFYWKRFDNMLQRAKVDPIKESYAMYYKCYDAATQSEADVELIDTPNRFGMLRRKYTLYDTMVYFWKSKTPTADHPSILGQIGPDPTEATPTTTPPEKNTSPTVSATTITESETIIAKAVVKKATKKKSAAKLKISLKKLNNISGYQVQVSIKRSFRPVLVSKYTTKTSLTITERKLKKKTAYTRARAYVMMNNDRQFGSWSTTKTSK